MLTGLHTALRKEGTARETSRYRAGADGHQGLPAGPLERAPER